MKFQSSIYNRKASKLVNLRRFYNLFGAYDRDIQIIVKRSAAKQLKKYEEAEQKGRWMFTFREVTVDLKRFLKKWGSWMPRGKKQ